MKKRNLNSKQLRLMSVGLLASSAVLSVADSAPIVAKDTETNDTIGLDEQESVEILASTTEETIDAQTSEETVSSSEDNTSTQESSSSSSDIEETTDSSTIDSSTTDSSTIDSSETTDTSSSTTSSSSSSSTSSSTSTTTSSTTSSTSTSTTTSKPKPAKPKPKPKPKPTNPNPKPNRPVWVGSVDSNVQGPVKPSTPVYPVTGSVVQGVGNGSSETIAVSPNLTTKAFIAVIAEDAREVAGTNDLYASVMIAQAILESASGNSTLASAPNYNLFGIKGNYKGASANFLTSEDNGSGSLYTIRSDFRKYPSYKESLEDYVKLLRGGTDFNNSFYSGTWKTNTKSYKDATSFLTGKYATDTSYAGKLNGLIEAYNLTQYDELKEKSKDKKDEKTTSTENLGQKVQKIDKKQEENIEFITHVVKKGESLKSISDLYNISTLAILEKNQLDRRMLFIGQSLKIPKQEVKSDEIRKEEIVDRSFEMAQKLSSAFSRKNDKKEGSASISTVNSSSNSKTSSTRSSASESLSDSSKSSSSTTASSSNVSSSTNDSSTAASSSSTEASNSSETEASSTAEKDATSSSDYQVSAVRQKTRNTYEVKEGDTLASISKKTGVSIWSLKEWNDLDQYFLTEGQLLVLNPAYKLDV